MTKQEAIEWAGGTQTKLAELLGIDQSSVSTWERIPDARQIQIERLSKKKLKADPDCWQFRRVKATA